MMMFETPIAFVLLLLIPALLYLRSRLHMKAGLRISTVAIAKRTRMSLRLRLRWLKDFLRVLALVSLVVAMARPQEGKEKVRDVTSGVAMEVVIDRSSSMGAEIEYKGRHMTRLDAVKKTFLEFVLGNDGELAGRPNDIVGLITFARFADTICPLTLSHDALAGFADSIRLVSLRSEDGTAIGDAIALAAARLKTAEDSLSRQTGNKLKDYQIKSKIIILLTDGRNNYGKRTPEEAAQLAKKWGIKIYSIGIGGGEAVTTVSTIFGDYKIAGQSDLDEPMLKHLSEQTGGFYRRADSVDSLKEIYDEIDSMEKTRIESVKYLDYREKFTPFALFALFALSAEVILGSTFLRKIP